MQRAVVARGPDGTEGYALFTYGEASGAIDFNYSVVCRHLVASTLFGMASLLSYLRGFRGLGVSLRFTGPPAAPLSLLIQEQRVLPVWTYRWMLRLLDVRTALEGRGYHPRTARWSWRSRTGCSPRTGGPWLLKVSDGVASVEPAEGKAVGHVQAISIGTRPRDSGFLSARDGATLGLVDASTCRRWLGCLMAGALDARLLLRRSPL